jgi:hypothetical protein
LHTVGALYSFSIMLVVFLSGLVIGSLVGTWWVQRRRASLAHFGSLELGIGLLAILVLFAFAQLPRFRLEDVFGAYSVAAEMAFEGLLSFVTLFPVTVLIGAVFPVVSSLYRAGRAEGVGWKVARVTALNTAGSILGSLLTGFVVVPALGLQNSVLALAALNMGVGLAALWFFGSAALRLRLAAIAVLVAAIVAALLQWVPLHSMSIVDYLSVLRTFQSVFPNATLWYTGGSHTLLLATPERLTDAGLEGMLQVAYDVPAVLQDLGEPGQIPRYWIMNSEQLREFAGQPLRMWMSVPYLKIT